ncbi:hypothetical protein TSA66_17800 [Noviherbaspirillum autotrophicum]|uniref:Uncharacterized protein n=1 Tax=Noviherbaspirillum autotrophicum TaxID=709839 RepID=A0A0C2BLV0_9BURK|nr:hypothetical protein TSA66_17800 [Noviherbaspirillum autotrophicum]
MGSFLTYDVRMLTNDVLCCKGGKVLVWKILDVRKLPTGPPAHALFRERRVGLWVTYCVRDVSKEVNMNKLLMVNFQLFDL